MAIKKKAGRNARKKAPVEMTLDYEVDVDQPTTVTDINRESGERTPRTVVNTVTEKRSETFMLRGEVTTLALGELAAHSQVSSASWLGGLLVREIYRQAFGDEVEYERFYRFAGDHLDDEDLTDLLADLTAEFGARPTLPSSGSSGTPAPATSGDASRGVSSPEDGQAASHD